MRLFFLMIYLSTALLSFLDFKNKNIQVNCISNSRSWSYIQVKNSSKRKNHSNKGQNYIIRAYTVSTGAKAYYSQPTSTSLQVRYSSVHSIIQVLLICFSLLLLLPQKTADHLQYYFLLPLNSSSIVPPCSVVQQISMFAIGLPLSESL